MAIVAANELLELDALAVFRDLTKAIVLHGRNLGEFHRTRNLAFGLTPLCPPAPGRKIRVLTIVDTFSRFSPAVDPRFSYRGEDVVLTLERICKTVGYPKTIRVDQGSEFISRDLDIWAYQKGIVLDFSRPGKPTDNNFIESFNGKFKSECLNTHWFLSLDDARQKMEDWRRDYNEVRPHSGIGNKAPISLLNGSSAPPPA